MTPPARKPRLDVYAVHNDDDGDQDVFWTLATAVGAPGQFRRASLDGERHAIHLHADIHRDHRIASGVLVVHDLTGVDAATRLAALHARREGVQRRPGRPCSNTSHEPDAATATAATHSQNGAAADELGVLAAVGDDRDMPRPDSHLSLSKVGRNSPCPCGSGMKFKRCCGQVAG